MLRRAHTAMSALASVSVRTAGRVTSSPGSATVRPGSKVNSASTDVHQVDWTSRRWTTVTLCFVSSCIDLRVLCVMLGDVGL